MPGRVKLRLLLDDHRICRCTRLTDVGPGSRRSRSVEVAAGEIALDQGDPVGKMPSAGGRVLPAMPRATPMRAASKPWLWMVRRFWTELTWNMIDTARA
jgi:hypothetical protein